MRYFWMIILVLVLTACKKKSPVCDSPYGYNPYERVSIQIYFLNSDYTNKILDVNTVYPVYTEIPYSYGLHSNDYYEIPLSGITDSIVVIYLHKYGLDTVGITYSTFYDENLNHLYFSNQKIAFNTFNKDSFLLKLK